MSCLNPLHQRLSGLALGELERERALELVAHVEACPNCAHDLDLYADLVTIGASPLQRPLGRLARWRARAPRMLFVVVAGFALLGVLDQLLGPSRKTSYAELADRSVPAATPHDDTAPFADEFAAALEGWGSANFEELELRLDRFLDLHPDHAEARLHRAIARRELGKLVGARADLRTLIDGTQGKLRDDAQWTLANLELLADDPAAALAVLSNFEGVEGDAAARAADLAERVRARR
ncbi:MAG: hypothetical protein HZA52_09725 [Planctomycetes bacterium]|nr:hypothetical protein [Planctomycetota bacterium]